MRKFSRRELLIGGGTLVAVTACSTTNTKTSAASADAMVMSTDPAVEKRDALRRKAGAKTVKATVTAAAVTVTIGGKSVETWAFGDRPGAGAIRSNAGDLLEIAFVNKLPQANTLHWHGIALRNDMDGVHDVTQSPTESGGTFTYRFTAPDPGTYWFHPHMGLELDRGLYAPLIIEDPAEADLADVDVTLMLDDWLDGFGRTPEQVLKELQASGGHSGHDMGDMGDMGDMMGDMGDSGMMDGMSGMGGLAGDVKYPLHLINGRAPSERETFTAKPGQKVRLRLINAGSDTAYRVAIADHKLTVTHADGFPVDHVEVDNVVLGMGERYDVLVTAKDGAFAIVAVPEGKEDPAAEAILRTATGAADPATTTRPSGLAGSGITYKALKAPEGVRLAEKDPDREVEIHLTADSTKYVHGIDGKRFPDSAPIPVRQGERIRLTVHNDTMMFHPIHLHGHTFQMVSAGSARKDTVNIDAMSSVTFDIEADNPGQWMFHCHNTYHLETGMATTLSYLK